jgi:hypothetical protein
MDAIKLMGSISKILVDEGKVFLSPICYHPIELEGEVVKYILEGDDNGNLRKAYSITVKKLY